MVHLIVPSLLLLAAPALALIPAISTSISRRSPRFVLRVTSDNKQGSATTEPVIATAIAAEKTYSFVNDEMRPFAMKLHTRDQAPKEGQQQQQKPFTQWVVQRSQYLQFLADSLTVYETFENIVLKKQELASLRANNLERSASLRESIQAMLRYDPTLTEPVCGSHGTAYSALISELAESSLPKFMCHYYNQYFAHTAGGRMIGKKMSDLLLEGQSLPFYEWKAGDVKALMEELKGKIDAIALGWSADEKQSCLEETMACFKYGGGLMSYMKDGGSK
jgi:heme oxygenase (biliverdin-producing, ferredoxin)